MNEFLQKMSPKTFLKIRDLKQHLKLMKYVAQKPNKNYTNSHELFTSFNLCS